MLEFDTNVTKPSDWPANARECQLENIFESVSMFMDNPGYQTREVLVSLVSDYDLNQRSNLGLFRVTDYEISIINALYLYASLINLNTLKAYLYEVVGDTTRMYKMMAHMLNKPPQELCEQYQYLYGSLKLYYLVYQQFNAMKNRSLTDQLIDIINQALVDVTSQDAISHVVHSYVTLLNDLSYFRCKKRNVIWAFSRDDLIKLFSLESKLVKMDNNSVMVSPLKGVLMTTISNYILKSRNSYNEDCICKYITPEVATMSTYNREIWMQNIECLNDKRELKVLPEMFANKQWMHCEWAKDIRFTLVRNYYVSSFSKTIDNTDMKQKYGQCIYGYKDDRIAELVAPIVIHNIGGKRRPFISQAISFDVLYSVTEAKSEINYLTSIIDLFDLTSQDKKMFLEEILQYWILSVKDKKWSYERERRYVLFMYENYEYTELDRSSEKFIKLKTSLLIFPDFLLGENPRRMYIREMIDEKRTAIATKNYMFCSECFSCDYDAPFSEVKTCSICGSEKTSIIEL